MARTIVPMPMPNELLPVAGFDKPERFPNIVGQNQNEHERDIKKIAVHVLHDQREGTFAQIGFARLAHRACRRIGPERFVIGASIIIAGEPEAAGRPEESKAPAKMEASPATNPVSAPNQLCGESPKISGE